MLILKRISFKLFGSLARFSTRKPIQQLLDTITHLNSPLITSGIAKVHQQSTSNQIKISLKVTKDFRRLSAEIKQVVGQHGYTNVEVELLRENTELFEKGLKTVKNVVAIAGRLGKTTVSLGLAKALAEKGLKVGLLETDVYNPALPALLKAQTLSISTTQPFQQYGVNFMSYGLLEESKSQSTYIRGTAASSAVSKMLLKTNWGDLDLLLIEMPNQNGDIACALNNQVKFDGGVVVSTALDSVEALVKTMRGFNTLKVKLLGVVQNLTKSFSDHNSGIQFRVSPETLKKHFGIKNVLEIPFSENPLSVSLAQILTFSQNIQTQLKSPVTFPIIVHFNTSSKKIDVVKQGKVINRIDPYKLRVNCRCPACTDQKSNRSLIQQQSLDKLVFPSKIEQLGNSAVLIQWSDGHLNSSFYPIADLTTFN